MQLINAVDFAWKMKKSLGDKRKKIGEGIDGEPDHIAEITRIYADFNHDETRTLNRIKTNVDSPRDKLKDPDKPIFVSKIFLNQDFGYFKIVVERPLRLNFAVSRERTEQFKNAPYFQGLIISKKRKDKDKIAEEIKVGKAAQEEILQILEDLEPGYRSGELIKNRKQFEKVLKKAFKDAEVSFDPPLKKALLSVTGLAEKDPTADPCLNTKGEPKPDPDLRDTENVPFPAHFWQTASGIRKIN